MRKVLISLIVITSVVLIGYGFSYALSGVCSNCHTMHNSQDGAAVAKDDSGAITTTPQAYLLKESCVTCHTAQSGVTQLNPDTFAPAVWHKSNPNGQGNNKTNAGGDFYWVALGSNDSKGHNVAGLGTLGVDGVLHTPPSWDPAATSGFSFGQVGGGTWPSDTQVTCAGTYGCHGQHNATGITGAHHANNGTNGQCGTTATAPTTVGSSFRFLGGIKGLEDSDWNWNEDATHHNEYFGVNDTSVRQYASEPGTPGVYAAADKSTISFLCAECHGFFHSHIDDSSLGSPWLRHPTDIALPNTAGTEYSGYTSYKFDAPVARPTVPGTASGTVSTASAGDTGAIAMCLSCHRAHGSDQPDLLRWTYNVMIAGSGGAASGTGCFACHTTKD